MAMSKPESFAPIWKTTHSFAAAAVTPEKRKELKRYVEVTIPTLLPCSNCARHWKANLKKYPIENYMGSEEQLLLWTYLMHSLVSSQIGKPASHTPSYNEVKRLYLPEPGKVVCETLCHTEGEGEDASVPTTTKARATKQKNSARRLHSFHYAK
jgi:hypothetical protein